VREVIEEFLYALDECFDGEGKDGGIFLEPEDPGLFSMLGALSAQEASRPIAGRSIANHVYHLIFAIDVFIKRVGAYTSALQVNWETSWHERHLSESEWEDMKKELARVREDAASAARRALIDYIDYIDYAQHLRLVSGLLTHTVFHLGIIRVKFDELHMIR